MNKDEGFLIDEGPAAIYVSVGTELSIGAEAVADLHVGHLHSRLQ